MDENEDNVPKIEPLNIEQFVDKNKNSNNNITCKSFFSCFDFQSSNNTKNDYMEKWKNYLEKEGNENANAPFAILTKLYANPDANEEVINELGSIRLNPNFASNTGLRNDLEFYIPQLCTFLLFGEMKTIEEFFVFLCKVCSASFFFAHRIYWFLSSLTNVEEKSVDIINIIKMINTLFISAHDDKKITNVYLSYANGYMNYIKNNDMYFLYSEQNPLEISLYKLDFQQTDLIKRYKKSRETLNIYCTEEHEAALIKEKIIQNQAKNKLNADDFFIDIMKFNTVNKTLIEQEEVEDFIKMSNTIDDVNFKSYHSTPNFIEHLCDISDEMSALPKDKQVEYLYKCIYEINLKLPGNVYLPFLKDSTRNYMICHIPITEIKIFRTKARAPIMLTFELIRLDEVSNDILDKFNNMPKIKDRSYSISSVRSHSSKKKGSIMDLEELDLDLSISKPMKLANKDNKPIAQKIKQEKILVDSIISGKPVLSIHKTENDVVQFAELKEEDENKINKIREQFKKKEQVGDITINTGIQQKNSKEFDKEIEKNPNDIDNDISNANYLRHRSNTSTDKSKIHYQNSQIDEEVKIESKKSIEDAINKSNSNISVQDDIKNVFGELFDAQHHRLKQTSLFGNLNSHRIFKSIVKTNEDLRQEQFATQLINEFYQIFQIEKVKCWLNTYEIIATGNRSGLIEMVPNSLSLDQLKQKTGHMSLRNFYLQYFGDGDAKSPHYLKAMKNFISSLAGYSLICYFLQIKDRHNGNILIDAEGHLIHIDFGFLLSNAPGKGLKFENAPFKLTNDMVDCLGGIESDFFKEFQKCLKKGYVAISKHRSKIIILVEMMWCGHGKNLSCFRNQEVTITDLKNRLYPRPGMSKSEKYKLVDDLIGQSVDNWRTRWYDIFQYKVQGIFY